MTAADGIGPNYCKDCKAIRKSEEPCGKCPEPHLLPENHEAVVVFLKVQTQWNYNAMGQRTGLNYPGVEVVMNRIGAQDPDLFEKVQALERETLAIDREKSSAN